MDAPSISGAVEVHDLIGRSAEPLAIEVPLAIEAARLNAKAVESDDPAHCPIKRCKKLAEKSHRKLLSVI